ncbi:glycerate kinase [Spelaeicoccus albus]|uniref:Glycerate kinase n=1 Tax=Spelaeicoccus albus TaxID=1280376 RepID=A0A7Z0ADA3_9MICO|nr:glycerate kinase [Spelaeicoccus albus]NYI67371.1 glycerate kinase [Spelaeicoccus albus]
MAHVNEDAAHSPRIVVAPDKFKGSLDAAHVCAAVAAGIREIAPNARIASVPIADGGDGTVAAALAAGYVSKSETVTGPVGTPVEAEYALLGDTAVIEMATASGLALLSRDGLDALGATSRGTGELIKAALDAGARTLVLGIGGSATTDAGAGMLEALGVRIVTGDGSPVPPGGGGLAQAGRVDLTGLDSRLTDTEIVLATDVNNPLTGPDGAAAVYGPQKGADPHDVALLDDSLERFAGLVDAAAADRPGAGAAGGMGYAAMTVLGATMRQGVDVVLELVGFAEKFDGADLLVTGEGKLDRQTLSGKAPAGAAAFARDRGVPVVAVCGANELGDDDLAGASIRAVYSLVDVEPDLDVCLAEPTRLLTELGRRIAREQLRA